MLESQTSVSATGKHFGVWRQTVRLLWLHLYETTGTVFDLAISKWAPPSADRAAGSLRHCHTPVEQTSQQRSLLATSPDWEYVLLPSGTVWVSKAYAQDTLLIGARAGHTRTELDHFKMAPCWRNRRRQPFVTRILLLICLFSKVEWHFFSNSITCGTAKKS